MPDPDWYVPKEKRKLPEEPRRPTDWYVPPEQRAIKAAPQPAPSLKPASDWYVPPEQRATKAAPAGAAPPRAQPKQASLDQLMESLSPEIEEGLRYVNPEVFRSALGEARKIQDRALRRNEEDRIRRAQKKARTFNKAVHRFKVEAKRRGQHDIARRLTDAQRKGRQGELKPVEVLKAGGTLVIDALDALHKYGVRSWTTPEREGDKPGKIVDSVEWAKRIRQEAKKGKAIPWAAIGLADLAAYAPGGALGFLVATAGAATDVVTGRPVTVANIKKTLSETQKDVSDFFLIMATDPLSWVSPGAAGATKNAMTATARSIKPMVAANTISKEAARELVDIVGGIASRHAGTPRALPKVKSAFRGAVPLPPKGAPSAVIKQINSDRKKMEQLALDVFGKKAEFFGKDQLTLHAPFASKWGINPLSALTKKEYAGGKALQAAHRGALKPMAKGEFKELFDPEKGFWKDIRRKAKAKTALTEQSLMLDYEKLAKLAPAVKSRREHIVRNYIDPKESPDSLPALSSDEQIWVDALDKFFAHVHDLGIEGGLFKSSGVAKNKFTHRYFPRQYKKQWGILEDLPDAQKRLLDRRSPAMQRESSLPLGAITTKEDIAKQEQVLAALRAAEKPDKNQIEAAEKTLKDLRNSLRFTGEADPHRAVPYYIQQVSRGIGRTQLEKEMVRAFRVSTKGMTGADLSPSFGRYTKVEEGFAVPNKAMAFIEGSFDDSMSSFKSWVSKMPGSGTAAGRGAIKALEYYGRTTNFWKRNVLVTRPGYHIVNFWNDTLQAMSDGNTGYALWLKRADGWIRGHGRLITPSGKSYSAEDLVALARNNNLPVDTVRFKDGRAVRLEAVGEEASNYHRFQEISRKGVDPGELSASAKREILKDRVVGKVVKGVKDYGGLPILFPKHGEALASAWEARAKLAHFAWRLKSGDSPVVAAQRTLDVLLDYSDPGRRIQVLRWFFPFATWTFTAPKMTARLIAKRPAAVVGTQRFFETQQAEDGLPPRSYVGERSPYYYMGPRGKQTLENLRYMARRGISPFTGETAAQSRAGVSTAGQSAVYMPREPFGESLTLPMEVSGLSGLLQKGEYTPKPEPLISAASPLIKGLGEVVFKKDVLTDREMKRPRLTSLFPARTPGIPRALRASREDEIPWASRYVLPKYMPPGVLLAANLEAYRKGGGEAGRAPLSTLGSYRPYAPPGQAENIYAQQILNMLTGIPAYTVSPADRPYEYGKLLADIESQLRTAKWEAKAAREATRRGRR